CPAPPRDGSPREVLLSGGGGLPRRWLRRLLRGGPGHAHHGALPRRGPYRGPAAAVLDALGYGSPEAEPGAIDAGEVEPAAPVAHGNPQAARRIRSGKADLDPGLPGLGVLGHVRQRLARGVR